MAKIYYCQPIHSGSGMLRAVLSGEEAGSLLKQYTSLYAGQQFPETAQGRAADFAVLHILDEEIDKKWQAGFYRFDADIMLIEESVQDCTSKLSQPDVSNT
jgi:hypothetical protein